MQPTRREFLRGTLGLAVAGKIEVPPWAAGFGVSSDVSNRSSYGPGYGSGNFGAWMEDEFGLPAFRYTLNQTTDPRAITDVQPGVLAPNEHVHQVGNDRIIALASNFGHVRVRQDEGCPKFLNDVDAETSQFGGGLGYLTDGKRTLTTYYDGSHADFERVFGIGYFRKKVAAQGYSVDQIISAPFGDEPVLISQVTIANHRDAAANLRWIEYWGCQPYQFSFRAFIEAEFTHGSQTDLRRDLGRRFAHRVTQIAGGHGLLDSKQFTSRSAEEEAAWQRTKAILRNIQPTFISPAADLMPGTEFETLDIPQTFLVSLDGPAAGFSSDAGSFFGAGGAAKPAGLAEPLANTLNEDPNHAGLLLERTFRLAPGESRTLTFLYGYLPEGFTLDGLVEKYRSSAATTLRESSAAWAKHGMRFEVASEPWVLRESTWNHYYLRSSQTFDDFFGEHILNQNGFYEYTMGFQGAARDPLQHSMPFLFSDPAIVRSILRYTLQEVRDDGSVPYAIVGHGVVAPMLSDDASDLPLWLLWTASEYVLATRDADFLNQSIAARFSATSGRSERVRLLLERCFRHQLNGVGVGQHGVMRMLVDDWNDGLIYTWASKTMKECIDQSESVLNSAMAAWVFGCYARMLDYTGDASLAEEARAAAELHRKATSEQWNGRWFRRAWLGPTGGWLGESTLWIEPQPWAVLSGAASESQARELVHTMDTNLRGGPLGATQMSDGPDMRSTGSKSVGTLELGAIWPSLNQTLVWALASIDPAMAWDEWKRNTLACHAASYPDIWYGVWSGNDSWNSPLAHHPGGAADEPFFHGTDFPALNLHSHACSLYSASKLLGMEFTPAGMKLRPALPADSWRFSSPLVGFARTGSKYEGWYAPSRSGEWTIEVALPAAEAGKLSSLAVNGRRISLERQSGGSIVIRGSSGPSRPLRWSLA